MFLCYNEVAVLRFRRWSRPAREAGLVGAILFFCCHRPHLPLYFLCLGAKPATSISWVQHMQTHEPHDELHILLLETIRACLSPGAEITCVSEKPVNDRGYSGAQMRLFDIDYATRSGRMASVSLMTKKTTLQERRASTLLYEQKHQHVPFCHTLDLVSEGEALLCQQFIQNEGNASAAPAIREAAKGLALIHHANMGHNELRTWLPPANRAYFESGYVLGSWRDSWAGALTDPEFEREFGKYSENLKAAAGRFLADMESLWNEGASLTLIHADLHADNIVVWNGQPYFVDWGQARYGSFYLDLPNYFPPAASSVYHEVLTRLDYEIPLSEFFERYREAGRYVGFKYMGFWLARWFHKEEIRSKVRYHLTNLIHLARDGSG